MSRTDVLANEMSHGTQHSKVLRRALSNKIKERTDLPMMTSRAQHPNLTRHATSERQAVARSHE